MHASDGTAAAASPATMRSASSRPPNGGSVALGHPFGAAGARDLSQTMTELAAMPKGSQAIVSVCADGVEGAVALLESI